MIVFTKRTFGLAHGAAVAFLAMTALSPIAARADDQNSRDTQSHQGYRDQGASGYHNRGRTDYQGQGQTGYRDHGQSGYRDHGQSSYQGHSRYYHSSRGRHTGTYMSYRHTHRWNGSQSYQHRTHHDENQH